MTVVASRYARALIEALGGENTAGPDAGLEQLGQIKLLLENEPDARKLLINPVIPAHRRDLFVDEISRVLKLDARVGKLLHLIVDRRRLEILDDMIDAYRKMLDTKNGIVRAVVRSASPLSAEQQQEVVEKLEKSLGRSVVMEVEEDPSLIGGLIVRIGSTVYDGSLVQQLVGFKERLMAG
jgi:F-type H+-transporting ATPase subunit delta